MKITHVAMLPALFSHALAANPFTKAALEMVCWDKLGQVAGLPVHRLLGRPVRPSG